jgi:putative transposase
VSNSPGYQVRTPASAYFITTTVVDWIKLFKDDQIAQIVLDSLSFCQRQKGLLINGWCLMPNHLHMICRAKDKNLPSVLRDFKRHTSIEIRKRILEQNTSRSSWLEACLKVHSDKQVFQVWQRGFRPKEIYGHSMFRQKLRYTHENPVKAKIVENAEDYTLSSARDYLKEPGRLEIEVVTGSWNSYDRQFKQ